jgi:SAM-dependent methyltransferase
MSNLAAPCRSCDARDLRLVLSLGSTPLANALRSEEQLSLPEETYPLDLAFCPECALLQITETVPPEKLFRDYLYFSSFSDTLLEHARRLAERVIASRGLNGRSLVVEVASNDGYLLQNYKRAGVAVLGVEPAVNIARVAAEERGIPTVCDFFGEGLARSLREGRGLRADVIHAHNVLAHVADLNGFVRGLALLLKEDGEAIVEVPYARDMIEGCEFDTIYHEHLCYFSLTALDNLFRRHRLLVADVEHVPIHGGTLRLFVRKQAEGVAPSAAVREMLADERARGMAREGYYTEFGARVARLRADLLSLLARLKREGRRVAVYGASAKGSTLLNYFGLGRETLDFVVDRSTVKQGLYTPGTALPIHAPERLLEEMPDYVLLLTWNFAEEILAQQQEYRRRGGRFIIPIPELKIV